MPCKNSNLLSNLTFRSAKLGMAIAFSMDKYQLIGDRPCFMSRYIA
jgi:hypothetical protein